jgi:carboxymethylenebutenolidase
MRQGLVTAIGIVGLAVLLGACSSTDVQDDELEMTMKEHGNDSPVPTPMAQYEPAQPVSGEAVVYTLADGQEIEGWLSRPVNSEGDLPGLIVIHEWWGLNDNLRRTSERLAGEGYVTLAVDLHRGQTADTPKDAMKMGRLLSQSKEPALANLADAHAFLSEQAGVSKIGVIGWCQGGRWSMQTALHMPEQIDAVVIYYGRVPSDETELAVLNMPVLGVFAGDDFIVPPQLAYQFAGAMAHLKKDLEFYMYRDAAHAFSNPSGTEYNPEAAADAWKHTTAFLQRNLQAEAAED